MAVLDDLADALARDAIAAADELGDEAIIRQVGDQLGASSSTMQEAYLTSIRIRLAEQRARKFLETQLSGTELSETTPD
ncbi:MAG: hypothetical protein QNI90_09675 [Dinoroseobacter sp.]|nr:hypothetical protein [Dinoroseobacter sp.]MDJ0993831.1 hypothetical protein [Dinoroseobacter sp.]